MTLRHARKAALLPFHALFYSRLLTPGISTGKQAYAPKNPPAWNPAALLQPNRRAQAHTAAPDGRSAISASARVPPQAQSNASLNFQFSTPEATHSDEPSGGELSYSSNDAGRAVAGSGNWVERIHNVQARAEAPEPKRRRVDTEGQQNGTKMPFRSGSGILGQYVKDKSQESSGANTPQSMTVDLTDGMRII